MRASKMLFIAAAWLLFSCSVFKVNSRKQKSNKATAGLSSTDDTTKIQKPDSVSKIKPYKEVVTDKAVTDTGLITVHKLENKYFIEISRQILRKDILVVTRIVQAAAENRPGNHMLGYAGDQINENVIQFVPGPMNKLFVKRISYSELSADTSENGLYHSVYNSNFQPVVSAFEIKTYGKDSSIVIDFSDYLNGDNDVLFFNSFSRTAYLLAAYQNDKSYMDSVRSLPANLEIKCYKTYAKLGNNGTMTYGLNTSLILLPEKRMTPRLSDNRIGYFERQCTDFDAPQGVQITSMITRWRLEPKAADIDKYNGGELVEPIKPIVYYIDPATPRKWIPYLIQGVNDWQKAFEKAGFKNAIYALEAPINNPEWSLYDARHNAIIYKPSILPNASGPHVHDPRTGEILETHINWYHNVQQLIHDWYMVQAGPNDPRARKMIFDDELMGQLIRFVVSHEVGHTLGLAHNFGASSTVPVDSLRNKNYLENNGFCPSIMDYARFNYVAQPEDGLSPQELMPRIGVYDEWAIEWGYRWLPEFKSKDDERAYMNRWIISKVEEDKRLFYGAQCLIITDPRSQSEDLSDDVIKANTYGILNLKRMMAGLPDWAKEANKDYTALSWMRDQVTNQYIRYIFHVSNYIGLNETTPKTSEQVGEAINFLSRETQKRAIRFLNEELFKTPHWLMDKTIFGKLGTEATNSISSIQYHLFYDLINYDRYYRMSLSEIYGRESAYSFDELLTDLEHNILSELRAASPIEAFKANLQRAYIERLINTSGIEPGNPLSATYFGLKNRTSYISIIHKHMRKILREVKNVIPKIRDEETQAHLITIRNSLENSLTPTNAGRFFGNNATTGSNTVEEFRKATILPSINKEKSITIENCWDNFSPIQQLERKLHP